jgi:ABC-2 type transport system ATP-binding protein
MAREKLVELTVERDLSTESDAASFTDDLFLKTEIIGPRTVAITYNKDHTNAGGVMRAVQKRGYEIVDVTTREADLEDVFLNLTRPSPSQAA